MRERTRIAWAITGAGHNLEACADLLLQHNNVDIFLSRAAEEVIRIYALENKLVSSKRRIYHERLFSAPLVVRLFRGDYKVLVVAPATSNSVAKFVCGISDSLVTNMFAQAGKSRVDIIVMPTDIAPEMDSIGPHHEPVKVYPRPIDLENTARLRRFAGVCVVDTMEDMRQCLAIYL
jgi:dihydromethanopterin reductase (acceptor)